MPDVKRTVRVKTHQEVNGKDSGVEGFPQRSWSVEISLVNDHGGPDVPARVYDKVLYTLHPSFGDRDKQTFKDPPFRCAEEGWGEFDMSIKLSYRGGEHEVVHDLNFAEEDYEKLQKVTFKNPKPELMALLAQSGSVPGGAAAAAAATPDAGANGAAGRDSGPPKKKSRKSNNVDMEKLAEGLQRLTEDDLLHIVNVIHEQKTPETYTKNDVENGEFHVDLYTLPDALVKHLWDYCVERGAA